MRTKITIIGIVASVGYFIFHWAKWLADFFAITHLPHDIGELLAAMSDTP